MKKTTLMLATTLVASFASAESIMKPVNDLGYGTVSGRIQSLSMYRDFENTTGGDNGANSTVGIVLEYTTPVIAGFDAGVAYNYAGEIYDNNNTGLLANDEINVLNEGWARYNFGALNLTNTTATAGRKINNAEVFRADDFRQKARSIETVQFESTDHADHQYTVGHALRMSNWIQAGDRWDFNDFGDVFGAGYDTDGITWGEAVSTRIEGVEVALFDAYAWDVANLIGARAKYNVTEDTALLGYYRNERDIGRATDHDANVIGLSVAQNVGGFKLEGGYFGVFGDNLRFQETTIGINHALGSSMMIYSGQFSGDANTLYAKAVTKLEQTKTTLYGLYNYSRHDTGKAGKQLRSGHELNLVVKQPVPKLDNLTMALKLGLGYRDGIDGAPDTFATDTRLFITYAF